MIPESAFFAQSKSGENNFAAYFNRFQKAFLSIFTPKTSKELAKRKQFNSELKKQCGEKKNF